jgi:hypothetical protein
VRLGTSSAAFDIDAQLYEKPGQAATYSRHPTGLTEGVSVEGLDGVHFVPGELIDASGRGAASTIGTVAGP